MSFYTSLSGLKGAQSDLSVISNNIANVGSIGFKKSRAEFETASIIQVCRQRRICNPLVK